MEKIVMAFGSFDILHPGHLLYLERAKRLGDRLVVVVARDSSIAMFKHRKPVMDEADRLAMVRALRVVDTAVLGARLNGPAERVKVIIRYKPAIIALGYDQRPSNAELEPLLKAHGIRAKVVRIRYSKDGRRYKSSKFRKRPGSHNAILDGRP